MSKVKSQILISAFICVFSAFLSVISPVHAQTSSSLVTISPVIFNISLSPGKTYAHTIQIKNNLDVPLPLQVILEDLSTPDDEIQQAKPNNSIVSWVNIKNTSLLLEAKKERSISFDIQVPSRVPLGGYYGMIYLRPLIPKTTENATVIAAKIGVLLLGSVGVQEIPRNKVEIRNISYNTQIYEKPLIPVSFFVKNTALNHFSAKPRLVIKPLIGTPEYFDFEEKFVFPGKSRKWQSEILLKQYPFLFYKTTLSVSVGGGIQQTDTSYIIAFPMLKLLLLLTMISIIITIYRKRHRLKEVMRILIKG